MNIAVVGSLNIDMVVRAGFFPRPGETIFGDGFHTGCGGKGANQAVACGKLGGDVAMIGCVGNDEFGRRLLSSLEEVGVNTDYVKPRDRAPSGCALITIAEESQNSIVVVPGANALLGKDELAAARDGISKAAVLLLQLETPPEANRLAARIVKEASGIVILDPAPATGFRRELLEEVDIITPNRTEIEMITGVTIESYEDLVRAMDCLAKDWSGVVIAKMGDQGAYWRAGGDIHWCPPFDVDAIDTVAAGDAFNGALAVALSEGKELSEAIEWASAVGALSVTRQGAQEAMPTRAEVFSFLASARRCRGPWHGNLFESLKS